MNIKTLRRYVTEALGTFFLVLTIGLVVGQQDLAVAALAIGVVLMVAVYAGGYISGGHYNPAISLAAAMAGKMKWSKARGYMGFQLIGSIIAAFFAYALSGHVLSITPAANTDRWVALVAELIFTFALVYTVLNVAMTKETEGNSYYGTAIGLIVMVGVIAVGGLSGGAFNPAVAAGPELFDTIFMGGGSLSWIWLYLIANFGGGVLAALWYTGLHTNK